MSRICEAADGSTTFLYSKGTGAVLDGSMLAAMIVYRKVFLAASVSLCF